jgi:hypothetical protein
MSCHVSELVEGDMAKLVLPVNKFGLWICYAIFLIFDNGRCCGSILESLEVEVSHDGCLPSRVAAILLLLNQHTRQVIFE